MDWRNHWVPEKEGDKSTQYCWVKGPKILTKDLNATADSSNQQKVQLLWTPVSSNLMKKTKDTKQIMAMRILRTLK